MSESDMRGRVLQMLKPLDAIAVENPTRPGTPDVNYTVGWIELKWLRFWPVHDQTIVTVEHFSQEQRVWLVRRRLRNGRAYLLLQVRREWLLFDGAVAAMKVGRVSRQELIESTLAYWSKDITAKELIKWISVSPLPTLSEFSLNVVDVEKHSDSRPSDMEYL